ncbi:hypothetical protein L6452_28245 [Arctium lappa]|uniref:Uncharacterized protein n=1 Tax=Arctium lappa TaxID=4217 RepID=A0ACB8ZY66_ARCLA|nr:hypothetical protein L6452_28245 [Arctium lappa]
MFSVFNHSIMEEASFATGDFHSLNEIYVHDIIGSSKTLPVVGMAVDDGFYVDSPTTGLSSDEDSNRLVDDSGTNVVLCKVFF